MPDLLRTMMAQAQRATEHGLTRTHTDSHGPTSVLRATAGGKRVLELTIYGEIDDLWGIGPTAVGRALKEAGEVDAIEVRLNSPGGYVFDGIAIYNLLRGAGVPVTVVVDGWAASAASVVMMAGDRIEMGEGTMAMIHNAWTIAVGNAQDLLEVAAVLEKIDGEAAGIYQRRSGNEIELIREWMNAETWFTAAEAVDAGLADEAIAGDGKEKERALAAAEVGIRAGWYRRAPKEMVEEVRSAECGVTSEKNGTDGTHLRQGYGGQAQGTSGTSWTSGTPGTGIEDPAGTAARERIEALRKRMAA